jgi:parallel beta-helix repeat protein
MRLISFLSLLFTTYGYIVSGQPIITITPSSSTTGDYYSVIQNALINASSMGGGIVYISAGTYELSSNIAINSSTYLQGAGIDKTILTLKANAASWWSITGKNAGFIRADTMDNIKISDITLNGNKANQLTGIQESYGRYGIFMEACNDIIYDRVKIENFQGYGFDPHGFKPTMTYTNNLTITNCISDNNDWDGFTIDQSTNVLVQNNTATNNGRHGFNIVTGSKNVIVDNNYAENNGFSYHNSTGQGCGIMVQNNLQYTTRDVTVTNNIIYIADKGGVCINDVINATISKNTILYTDVCLQATNATLSTMSDNNCMTNTTYSIMPSSGVTLTNNINGTLPIPTPPPIALPIPISSPNPYSSPLSSNSLGNNSSMMPPNISGSGEIRMVFVKFVLPIVLGIFLVQVFLHQ